MLENQNLNITYVLPGELSPNPWNPNVVDSVQQEKIINSLREKGFFKPVLVREVEGSGLEIIGGEHRVVAAKELGIEVPIVNLGVIEDGEAKLVGQLDNAQYGQDDENLLSKLFQDGDMGDPDLLLSVLPMNESYLEGFFSNDIGNESLEEMLNDLNSDEGEDNGLNLEQTPTTSNTQILRFKVSNIDGDFVTELINKTRLAEGYKDEDALTNAGDALICLLRKLVNGDAFYD